MRVHTYALKPPGWTNLHSGATTGGPTDVVYAGALPLGAAKYTIPATNVVYLSTSGSDANTGLTTEAPKATLQAAIAACPSGGTIVVRGGVYEQKFSGSQSKPVTIQNYYSPTLGVAEEVIFDGSRRRTTWTNNGNGTWTGALFAQFTNTMPTGFANGIETGYPMAIWPDMVHINGVRLNHRPATETPTATQFTMDYAANTVTIGQDPAGKEVRLSALDRWMVISGNCTVRGIGIRRYATTLSGSDASVIVAAPTVNFENVVIEDCGIQSIAWRTATAGGGMNECTIRGAGMVGLLGDGGSGITFSRLLVEGNNFNLWRNEPGAGGIKLGRFTNSTLRDSVIRDNNSAGLWCDVSCYNLTVFNNVLHKNRGPAFEYELSRLVLFVNNWITGAGTSTIWGLDAGEMRLWNNMIDRAVSFDVRLEEDLRAGVVSSGENPDGVQDWRTDQTEVCNNVLANYSNRTGVWRLYSVNKATGVSEDTSAYFSRIGGNVWSSTSATTAARMATFENAAGAEVIYTTPAALGAGLMAGKTGTNTLAVFTAPTQGQLASWASIGDAVPADVAALLGVPVGTKVVGPVVPAPVPR